MERLTLLKQEKSMQYEIGFSSHTGTVKELNEDNYCCERREEEDGSCTALMSISDGVGGFSLGEIASKIAINHMEKFYKLGEFKQMYEEAEILEPQRVIQELYTRINHVILSLAEKENRQVGCTLVSGFFNNDSIYIASAGNSRAYLIRGGALKKLTEEREDPLAKVDLNKLTSEETLNHGRANSYVNAMGSDVSLRADIKKLTAKEGDIILFCSDGLYTQVDEMDIVKIAAENPSMQAFCNALVDKANFVGGKDNVTVVAVRVTRQKKSLRDILSSSRKGRKRGPQPLFVILILLGILFFLGTVFVARKYIYKKPEPPASLHLEVERGSRNRGFNSFNLRSRVPINYILVNDNEKTLVEDVGNFSFSNNDNKIIILPDLQKIEGRLFKITMTGLKRNLTVVQSKTNLVELDYENLKVHLTAGSRIDYVTKEDSAGQRFILRIDNLGSPVTIHMNAEENINAVLDPFEPPAKKQPAQKPPADETEKEKEPLQSQEDYLQEEDDKTLPDKGVQL